MQRKNTGLIRLPGNRDFQILEPFDLCSGDDTPAISHLQFKRLPVDPRSRLDVHGQPRGFPFWHPNDQLRVVPRPAEGFATQGFQVVPPAAGQNV